MTKAIKYKVVSRIIVDDDDKNSDYWEWFGHNVQKPKFYGDTLAYKIIAGLYIFYISEDLLNEGIRQGIIEPPAADLRLGVGVDGFYRIMYALSHSDIDYLTRELDRVNTDPKIITVTNYEAIWWDSELEQNLDEPVLKFKAKITVDASSMEIIENTAAIPGADNELPKGSLFRSVKDYEGFVDVLAMEADRTLCNSRNLYDRYEGNGFFSQDRWFQQLDKYVFEFEDEPTQLPDWKYPQRANDEMAKSYIVMGEKCFQLYQKDDTFYIKGVNLYGYREIWCKVRIAGDIKKSNMYIDFVSSNMSECKKYELLYDIERQREEFFDIFIGKYRSEKSYSHKQYKKWVLNVEN